MVQKAKYPLGDVKELVNEYLAGNKRTVVFSAPPSSIKRVARVFLCDESEAAILIVRGILQVENESFSRAFVQWEMVVDEYGLESFMGHNWYVKLAIVEVDCGRVLDEISFHPLEKPMKVADGRVLGVTWTTAKPSK